MRDVRPRIRFQPLAPELYPSTQPRASCTLFEEIPDGAVHRQKPLSLSSGFEPSHLSFALPGRLMRNLCSVVRVARCDMLDRGHHTPVRGPIASELVGDQPSWFAPLREEPPGRTHISPSLDQDVNHVTVLINRTPQIVARLPRMLTNSSSRNQVSPRRPCRRRSFRA